MENINVNDTLLTMVGILQHVLVPVFALLTLVGLIFFNISFKNPMKRRIAFLLTLFGPIGFLLFLFGPTILYGELFTEPNTNKAGEGIEVMADWADSAGSPIYFIFSTIALTAIMAIFPLGLGFKLMAFKAPALSRIGTGMILGATVLWILVETGPTILRFFYTI